MKKERKKKGERGDRQVDREKRERGDRQVDREKRKRERERERERGLCVTYKPFSNFQQMVLLVIREEMNAICWEQTNIKLQGV